MEKKRKKDYYQKYPTAALADDMIDNYIHRIEAELEKFERMTERMEEAVSRVGLANRYQANVAASSTPQENTATNSSLAEENARLINNMLLYGIRPSYASPVDDGYGGLEIGRGAPTPPHPGGRGR